MTLYRFFSSKSSLPEWGESGFKEIAREQFNPLGIEFYFTLPETPDKVVYVEDVSRLEQFQVVKCNQLPEDTGEQIQKPYIYELRGKISEEYLTNLVRFVKEHVKEEDKVELWSIWHGERVNSNQMKRLMPQTVTIADLDFLHQCQNSCIKFFPKNK
ncbi:hypothetical protein P9B03_17175 [Metasolibacillus meyeri]|uniref:Uncharacterized protein n=1 Tax=Metasolibacillus meyeri TaxID=1071052 RepID=A0AAW9NVC3_9BACL|nr:hypothetical protein [Metasolibacillus meyeri]MEC1180238.1 hypothetical protein [Metasolibacillus meyeri]